MPELFLPERPERVNPAAHAVGCGAAGGRRHQNISFAPSWKMRGAKVPLSCPKSVAVTVVLRLLNCVWLKVLNDSARNSNRRFSLNWNALNSAMFQLLRPGVTTEFLAALPNWSGPGFENDEVLNH